MKHRILVIGSPGSGKSTLSLRLQEKYHVPFYHIDKIQWLNNKETVAPEVLKEALKNLVVTESWIIDGNYTETMSFRVERATTIIWIKEPRWKCIYRVIKRYISSLFKKQIVGANPKTISFEFLKYIWEFPENNYATMEHYHLQTSNKIQWLIGNNRHIYKELNI
ncbi:topology modulation protein [Staphylococcus petrasii]|nr:topology modulation protein [Staphylococcus petrasii]PNZ84242.1 topology modulation protein [Staphylococcus petrasii]TGA81570.1 topology modulation protein [Staphylococcus petrasii]SUM59055.1 putative DNA topology modulation protein FlaR [Staphylococcus petrasii]